MAILRIWLTFLTVHAPDCKRVTVGINRETAYDQLVDNSHHLGVIEVQPNQDGLASHLDVRLLNPNSGVIRYIANDLYQRTTKKRTPKWMYGMYIKMGDSDSGDLYVVTERAGTNANAPGLVGYASVSKNGDAGDPTHYFNIEYLEVCKMYRCKGVGQQLSTMVFSRIMDAGGNVFLQNRVDPARAGARMYLSSAQKAGYKFAHVTQEYIGSPSYHAIPLVDVLSKSNPRNEFLWVTNNPRNIFVFTLGQHSLYRLASVDTVHGLHSMKFKTRQNVDHWNSFILPEWKTLVNEAHEYTSFFIFAPHATEEPIAAVLMQKGGRTHKLVAFHQKAPIDSQGLRILLDATFLNADEDGHSPLSISTNEFEAKRSTIMAAATSRGYLLDLQRSERSNDYTFTSVEPAIRVNRVNQETLDIPRDWITTIGDRQQKYNIVAAFDSVGQKQAAVLVKIRNNGDHEVLLLWRIDPAEQFLNILQVMFSDALQDMSRVLIKPSMFPEWSRVMEVATALGYSGDSGSHHGVLANDDYVFFRAM